MEIKKRSELLKGEQKEMRWLVQDLIPYMNKPIMISGCPGSGKSLLGYQLASCVAYGTPFLNHQTFKFNSMYLSFEDDEYDLSLRSQKSEKKVNPDAVEGNCFVFAADYTFELTTVKNGKITTGKDFEELKSFIIENEIKLIVIDHLSKIFCGDENNRNQVNEFGNILYQLCKDAKTMVIILAHTNKTDNQYSGSSANAGIYRMAFLLTYSKSSEERTLSLLKSNSTSHIKPQRFIIDDDLFCSPISDTLKSDAFEIGKVYTREELCNIAGEELNTRAFAAFAAANKLIKEKNRKKINGILKTVYKKGE